MSSSSVKRVFSSVRAVINLAIREHGLSVTNVFSGTFIPDDEVKKKRSPISAPDLVNIQQECMALDDEPRWLIALISDTGMRLSEACGLQAGDIIWTATRPISTFLSIPGRGWRQHPVADRCRWWERHSGQHRGSRMQALPSPSPNTAAKPSAMRTLPVRR